MSVTVLVLCPHCTDGAKPDGCVCGWCNGMGHIAVNRTVSGGVPEGCTEWMPPMLPTPHQPEA
jgi:DnaJ-class molecular chaperone